MLHLIDKLAGLWMDWRTDWEVRNNPELKELDIKKVRIGDEGMVVTMSTPAIAILADHAAALLDEHNADNYVEFQMMPRVDRGIRPILVTVKWSNGMSPSQKAAIAEQKLDLLVASSRDVVNVWNEDYLPEQSDWLLKKYIEDLETSVRRCKQDAQKWTQSV